jgi:hypothetical protein
VSIEIKRPELEALIQQRLHSGAFETVEDVLFDALEIQREREAWLQENKTAIGAKIQRGLTQLDRGEGIAGAELRERLAADRAAWLKDHSDK